MRAADLLEAYSCDLGLTGVIVGALNAAQTGLALRLALGDRRRQGAGFTGCRPWRIATRQTTRQNPAGLTTGPMKVLTLLAPGLPNSEIARQLCLSPRTVDHHVSVGRSPPIR